MSIPYLQSGPAEVQEHFATIRQNGQFLLALIDDLLDLSRIEAGQLRIDSEPCSPQRIIADVVETSTGKSGCQRASLEVNLDESLPPTIATDRWRLQQILVNSWIMRSSSPRKARSRSRPGRSASRVPLRSLQFAVSDMGIGMTEAEMGELVPAVLPRSFRQTR